MRGEFCNDVIGNKAANYALLVFSLESDQLHRPLNSRRIDDVLDHAPDCENASGQDVIIPQA